MTESIKAAALTVFTITVTIHEDVKIISHSSSKILFLIGCHGFLSDDLLKILGLLLHPIITLHFHCSLIWSCDPICQEVFPGHCRDPLYRSV